MISASFIFRFLPLIKQINKKGKSCEIEKRLGLIESQAVYENAHGEKLALLQQNIWDWNSEGENRIIKVSVTPTDKATAYLKVLLIHPWAISSLSDLLRQSSDPSHDFDDFENERVDDLRSLPPSFSSSSSSSSSNTSSANETTIASIIRETLWAPNQHITFLSTCSPHIFSYKDSRRVLEITKELSEAIHRTKNNQNFFATELAQHQPLQAPPSQSRQSRKNGNDLQKQQQQLYSLSLDNLELKLRIQNLEKIVFKTFEISSPQQRDTMIREFGAFKPLQDVLDTYVNEVCDNIQILDTQSNEIAWRLIRNLIPPLESIPKIQKNSFASGGYGSVFRGEEQNIAVKLIPFSLILKRPDSINKVQREVLILKWVLFIFFINIYP